MSYDSCRPNSEPRLPGVAVILSSAFEPISAMDGPNCRSDHSTSRYHLSGHPARLGPPRKTCVDLPPERNSPSELSFSHRTRPFVSADAHGFDPISLRHQHREVHKHNSLPYHPQPSRQTDFPGPRLEPFIKVEPREANRSDVHSQWPEPQERRHIDNIGLGLQQVEPYLSSHGRPKMNKITDRSHLSSVPLSKGAVHAFSRDPAPFRDALQTSIPSVEASTRMYPQLIQSGPKHWNDPHQHPQQPGLRRHLQGPIDQAVRTSFVHPDAYPSPRQQLSAYLPSISPPYSALRSALPMIGHLPLTPQGSTPDPIPEDKIKETYPSPPSTEQPSRRISSFAPLPLSLEDLVDPAPVKSDTVDDDVRISGQILAGLAKARTPVLGLGVGFDGPPVKTSSVLVTRAEIENGLERAGEMASSEDGSESNDEIIPTTRTPSPMPVSRSAGAPLAQSKRTKKRANTLPVSTSSLSAEPSCRRSWNRSLSSASASVSKTSPSSQISANSLTATPSGSAGTSEKPNKSATPRNSKRRAKKPKTKVSMENYDPEHPRPFGCDMCLERFLRKNDYVRHQRIHSGDKPYVCPICATGFMRNDALLRHIDHTSACAAQAPSREEFVFGMGGLKRRKSFSVSTASEPTHTRNHKKRKV